MVQNRYAGEQGMYWKEIKTENYIFNDISSLLVLFQFIRCSSPWQLRTTWTTSCKGPIPIVIIVNYSSLSMFKCKLLLILLLCFLSLSSTFKPKQLAVNILQPAFIQLHFCNNFKMHGSLGTKKRQYNNK